MNYREAIEYINKVERFGSKPGLERIINLLDLLDNPQDKLKCIHVGGTNGKGSTSSYMGNMLRVAGYRVGIFSSPHIESINERLRINGINISNEDFAQITSKVVDKVELMLEKGLDHPTTFEIMTAMSFLYFYEQGVDFVILEVGLGGRLDSTNVIKENILTVLTKVNMDHTNILGNSLAEIGSQKAGIIKEGSFVISYPQEKEVEEIFIKESEKKKAKIEFLSNNNMEIKAICDKGSSFNYRDDLLDIKDIEIKLIGRHQVMNASLAIKAIGNLKSRDIINISGEEMKKGLVETTWPARLELLLEEPKFIIDGAHNVDGALALKNALDLYNYDRLILGIGILKDKDYNQMVNILLNKADIIIVTEISGERRLEANDLGDIIKKAKEEVYIEKDVRKAIDRAIKLAGPKDMIIFAGSLYLVSEVRAIIKQLY